MWNNQNLETKIVKEDQPDRAREQFDSDKNRLDLEITIATTTLDISNEVQLIDVSICAHKI
jgi:hypothetical protein